MSTTRSRNYHFAMHDKGTQFEELDDMELRGDSAAVTGLFRPLLAGFELGSGLF
jgi:hypothetical protein